MTTTTRIDAEASEATTEASEATTPRVRCWCGRWARLDEASEATAVTPHPDLQGGGSKTPHNASCEAVLPAGELEVP
jgi:hypothetical protein